MQTQVVIFLGPPGVGKGSQAALIQKKLKSPHISTGDLLRLNLSQGTAWGKTAKRLMDGGQLVPDDLICAMLFERIAQEDCRQGYLLDGFPRTIEQAEALQQRLADKRYIAINLTLSDSRIVERLSQRRVCKSCQASYHLTYAPPAHCQRCDKCGGPLYQRSDDTCQIVQSRLAVYHEKTEPLVAYYRDLGVLYEVDAARSKREIQSDLLAILIGDQ